jgi:uroporphyrinogen-III synthase
VTGNQNRDNLVKHLESDDVRAIVDTLSVYSTNKTDLTLDPSADRYRKLGADAILFTSSSAVKSFIDQQVNLTLIQEAKQPDFGSIGPLTTKTLKSLKLPVAFESPKAILEDFVVETITHLKRKL